MKCDQCDSVSINGVWSHERGCINTNKMYIDGYWIKTYRCFDCKEIVRQDTGCNCNESDTELEDYNVDLE